MRTASLGTLGLSWSATWRHWTFALSASSWAKAVATKADDAWMGQQVAKCTRQPMWPEDPGRGGLQALVVVGDHQLHAAQPAPGQRAQELGPEGLGDAPIAASRRPWSLTATATVTATETMRPVWRTFT